MGQQSAGPNLTFSADQLQDIISQACTSAVAAARVAPWAGGVNNASKLPNNVFRLPVFSGELSGTQRLTASATFQVLEKIDDFFSVAFRALYVLGFGKQGLKA